MYCRYCGKEIAEGVNTCPHCGKKQALYREKYRAPFYWCYKIMRFLGVILILYIISAVVSWFYLGRKTIRWSEEDNALIKLASERPEIGDSIALQFLKANHYAYDLFGADHMCKGYDSYIEGEHHKTISLSILKSSANGGNVNSMVMLGRYYK